MTYKGIRQIGNCEMCGKSEASYLLTSVGTFVTDIWLVCDDCADISRVTFLKVHPRMLIQRSKDKDLEGL